MGPRHAVVVSYLVDYSDEYGHATIDTLATLTDRSPGHGPRLAPAALQEAYRGAFDVELSIRDAERLLPRGDHRLCPRSR